MEELIKYFESLEARLNAAETRIAALEAQVEELQNRPLPEPQVVEKIVEKIVEEPVEKLVEIPESLDSEITNEPEPVKAEPEPAPAAEVAAEPEPAPVVEETTFPKAAIYGKPVEDIRQAISLGDRFLYQRELFGQNAELMQKALTELNALGSFEEAINYIRHFGWDTESSTYQQFIVTLHRRFG